MALVLLAGLQAKHEMGWDKHGFEYLSQGQNPNGAKREPKGLRSRPRRIQ